MLQHPRALAYLSLHRWPTPQVFLGYCFSRLLRHDSALCGDVSVVQVFVQVHKLTEIRWVHKRVYTDRLTSQR